MANTANEFPLVPPAAYSPGLPLRATVDALTDHALSQNYLLRAGGVGELHQEGWPDGHFTHTGAATDLFWYRLPALSAAHLGLVSTFYVTLDVGTATITLTSSGTADTVAIAVAPGALQEVVGAALDVTSPYDDITINVATTGGGVLTIWDMDDVPVALAHPLPAAAVGGGAPIGINRVASDLPFDAALATDLRANSEELAKRRRPIWIKGGLAASVGQAGLHSPLFSRSWFRVWRGSQAEVRTLNAHAYVDNTTGADQILYWQIGDLRGVPSRRFPVPVADAFTGWKVAEIPLEEGDFLSGYPRPAAVVGIARDVLANGGRTVIDVQRVAVWEEWS